MDRISRFLRLLFFVAIFCHSIIPKVMAEVRVKLEFSNDSGVNAELRDSMEHQLSCLLSRMNEATDNAQEKLDLSGIEITKDAKEQLNWLWNNFSIKTLDDDIVEHCFALGRKDSIYGYIVREIDVLLSPQQILSGDTIQSLSIDFNSKGEITGVFLGIDCQLTDIAPDFFDPSHTMAILSFCEKLNSAYNTKDEEYLKNLFNDLLIETIVQGDSVQNLVGAENIMKNLRQMWNHGKWCQFDISELEVTRHPAKPSCYSVSFKHEWRSKYYSVIGYMFMVLKFTNDEKLIIYVCAWNHGYPLDKIRKFSIFDFRFH